MQLLIKRNINQSKTQYYSKIYVETYRKHYHKNSNYTKIPDDHN